MRLLEDATLRGHVFFFTPFPPLHSPPYPNQPSGFKPSWELLGQERGPCYDHTKTVHPPELPALLGTADP